jgi:hypothetical protein
MNMQYQGRELNKMKGLMLVKKIVIALEGDDLLIKAIDDAMERCLAEKEEELRQFLVQHNLEA